MFLFCKLAEHFRRRREIRKGIGIFFYDFLKLRNLPFPDDANEHALSFVRIHPFHRKPCYAVMQFIHNFLRDLFGAGGNDFKFICDLESLQNKVAHLAGYVKGNRSEERRVGKECRL